MTKLKYDCMKCGTCCHEIPPPPPSSEESLYKKRIPLYPDEVEKLIEIAKKRGITFQVIEDLVFPDILNQKILVLTYRIRLDNESQGCPFYNTSVGCTVHEDKPLACQAYPLALKQEDAFTFKISIDPLCHFVIENYEILKNTDLEQIKEIFHEEYPKAENHLKKNKKIMLKIRKLEIKKKIQISRQIKLEDFNSYLKEWERVEIIA